MAKPLKFNPVRNYELSARAQRLLAEVAAKKASSKKAKGKGAKGGGGGGS